MSRITVAIPAYSMYSMGIKMLERCLDSVMMQNFKDYDIVVCDNSRGNELFNLCEDYEVYYYRNPIIGMAANTNECILKSTGELIKILYQDDELASENSLQQISDNFKAEDNWLITASNNNLNPHFKDWNQNTLGSPSALTIRNKDPLLFEDLKYFLDLNYYQRMFTKFGNPKILNKVGVNIGLGPHQTTNHLSKEELEADYLKFMSQS